MTTNNLTEKWKKGELEDSEYYIKSNKGDIYIDICANGSFMFTNYRSIEEVFAPVPSFEQWQQMKAFCEEFNALDVAEENQKLKKLLKECKKTFFEIRLSLSSGKINSVFDLSYQRENDINEALK